MLIKRKIKLVQENCILGLFIMYLNGASDDLYQKITQKLIFFNWCLIRINMVVCTVHLHTCVPSVSLEGRVA